MAKRKKDLKLKTIIFSCYNYWAGGAPYVWSPKLPFFRPGIDIYKPKAEYTVEGRGACAKQSFDTFKEKVLPYIRREVFDMDAPYYEKKEKGGKKSGGAKR